MPGQFALILHAHLPFVRHPEHEKFLEESWLFEAITETYVPLVQLLAGWERDHVPARFTLTLTPTLCTMLLDPLLRDRYARRLDSLIALTQKEVRRTRRHARLQEVARMYRQRFQAVRKTYHEYQGNLVGAFRRFQNSGRLEIITCAATHALLPLLVAHPPSLRAQLRTACDHHRTWFGEAPRGIWLPECAYTPELDQALQEAGLRWFITETHGLQRARPRPVYDVFAPVFTPHGLAAFGRDRRSAEQVWSREAGYPGDPWYRDFYRDIGFDLDFDYVQPCLPAPHVRGFTGIKYHRITGAGADAKEVYSPADAQRVLAGHVEHFFQERRRQFQRLNEIMDRPPLVVAPYDAELFGHWWHEGPDFLDGFARRAAQNPEAFQLTTPTEYLRTHSTQQVATPAASSWGEDGHWRVWLNEKNEWIYPHLRVAQERMTELARRFPVHGGGVNKRALKQAAREVLLAQASDWPFILRNNTSPGYARQRVETHLLRFTALYEQLCAGKIDEPALVHLEGTDNIFPHINYRYWR